MASQSFYLQYHIKFTNFTVKKIIILTVTAIFENQDAH